MYVRKWNISCLRTNTVCGAECISLCVVWVYGKSVALEFSSVFHSWTRSLLKFHKFSTTLMKASPVLLTCLTNVTFVRLLTAVCCEADVTFGIYGSWHGRLEDIWLSQRALSFPISCCCFVKVSCCIATLLIKFAYHLHR